MTPKIPNNQKILIVLKELDVWITSKDLAEYTNIPVKNIGKNLKHLTEKHYISRKTEQIGKKRYIENKILAKGKKLKLDFTYDDLMKLLEEEDMKETVEKNNNTIKLASNMEPNKIKRDGKQIDQVNKVIDNKHATKTELLGMIKVIAIRDVDAIKLGLKDKQELIEKLISLILKL